MRRLLSILLGLLLLSLGSVFLISLLTKAGRDDLKTAIQTARRLADQEVTLLERLRDASDQLPNLNMPNRAIWPGADKVEVGLAMQDQLLKFAEAAELNLLSFGLGTTSVDTSTPTVSFDLELEGGHAQMGEFIRLTQNANPPLAISFLWIRQLPVNATEPIAPVAIRLTVWGFGGGKDAFP